MKTQQAMTMTKPMMPPPRDLINAVRADLAATAYRLTIEPEIKQIQLETWQKYKNNLPDRRTGQIIENPDNSYLALSSRSDTLQSYYNDCETETRKHGYNPKPGCCPLLEAESLERDAQHLVMEELSKWMKADFTTLFCKTREDVLELTRNLVVTYCTDNKIELNLTKIKL